MREIERIEALGVKIVTNHPVHDVLAEKTDGRFDAVLVAIGAQLDRRTEIPARDASARDVGARRPARHRRNNNAPKLGRRVIIYGGGNTAIDVCAFGAPARRATNR